MRFEWDAQKDLENQKKHGVPFELAQYAFADPGRVIAEDRSHGRDEKRFFCFGLIGGGSHGQVHGSWIHCSDLRRRILAEGKEGL